MTRNTVAALLLALHSALAVAIQASPVDTKTYFADPRLAEFADHIQKGDLAKVQAGLRAGISPNAAGLQGFTPIFFVFPAKNADVARELLKAGVNPNATGPNEKPIIHEAVLARERAQLNLLVKAGADQAQRFK